MLAGLTVDTELLSSEEALPIQPGTPIMPAGFITDTGLLSGEELPIQPGTPIMPAGFITETGLTKEAS